MASALLKAVHLWTDLGLGDFGLHFLRQLGADLVLQVAHDLPYVDRSCFDLTRPAIVPARTFLSQLV